VHAEEAQIVPGTKAGDDQCLLCFGWRGLLEHRLDRIQRVRAADAFAANRAEAGQQRLARRLHGRDRARMRFGDSHKLLRARVAAFAHAQVITDQMQKRLITDECARAGNCVAVSARRALLNKQQIAAIAASCRLKRCALARVDDHAQFADARAGGFLDLDLKGGFGDAVAVDEGLRWQPALA
jgi:hypothetical protein